VLAVTDKVMASLTTQSNPPDAIGVFRQRVERALPLPRASDVWVGLDAIRDPGNLGTIIRTVDASGASGVVLIGQACDPYAPDCVRATMGSIFAVPVIKMCEESFLAAISNWPGEIVATQMKGGEDYRRVYRGPVMLLMGSEARGLAPELAGAAGITVRIPMSSAADSLNVAIATAIMLYEIRRAELA
jgi:TrmH family RNA methyltransferase